jgi:hypothetical protein
MPLKSTKLISETQVKDVLKMDPSTAFTIGNLLVISSSVPRNFFRGGVQQIQLRTEGREKGDVGAVAP